ncbi:MAG: GTP-binding protein [Candidatus Altiarchaeales archaeon]|nr:GTP-binding protein [Candidatus Altiarchaeales archaeon]MBD3416069.1 GTP-binding protein [Candidatus Altiarchaeales archaeon]
MPHRRFLRWIKRMFQLRKNVRVGIYGPPNSGKTSLANKIIVDFVGGAGWKVSDIRHETRRIQQMEEVVLKSPSGKKLEIDLFDMPGISTKKGLHTDAFEEFISSGIDEKEARKRLMEATNGIASAVRFMRMIDSAIVVLDSTESPYTKVNSLLLGVLKSNNVKVIVAANKIDLPHSDPGRVKKALQKMPVVPISCKEGTNLDQLYEAIAEHLR